MRLLFMILLMAAFFMSVSCGSREREISGMFKGYGGRYAIYVSKKNFTLEVYDRDLKRIAQYRIGYGINPDRKAKQYSGDNRTPEGLYRIDEILSMDSQKESPSYKKLAGMNRVFFRARDGHYRFGHGDVDLGDNAYGPRFYGIDYPNKYDRQRYGKLLIEGAIKSQHGNTPGIGSGLAIHGNNDEASVGHLASSGCVRMYNIDVIDLEKYIQIGTPVLISPD
ncbi:MAG: L,D-transpeptidase [Spirochaetes bacterium]|jgi:murein L,D-transpeptidase YafK|nr:L,D-transpeptidase [Spirochaetota bacterium]